jgi:hypothetical protein
MPHNYQTTTTFQSTLVEGLVYKLRKMSQKRRMAVKASAASVYAEIRDLGAKGRPLEKEDSEARNAAKLEPCQCAGHTHADLPDKKDGTKDDSRRCAEVRCECRKPVFRDGLEKDLIEFYDEWNSLHAEKLYPILIREFVADVSGIDIDEKPVTVDFLFGEDTPDPVIIEVGQAIDRLMNLSFEEQLGFKQPGTSSAPADGTQTSSIVPPASV